MALRRPAGPAGVDTSETWPMLTDNADELMDFYGQMGDGGNWFEPHMLETGQFFATRINGTIVSAAGTHVYSPIHKVAALASVTTTPAYRRQGHGTRTIAALCKNLLKPVDHIGLNVKADNVPAISLYESLGFDPVAEYEEFVATAAPSTQPEGDEEKAPID